MELDQNRSMWSCRRSVPAHVGYLGDVPSSLFDRVGWDSEGRILVLSVGLTSQGRNSSLPGPPEAAIASSPIKKSRSSVPLFALK
jgi:hypothetical protein